MANNGLPRDRPRFLPPEATPEPKAHKCPYCGEELGVGLYGEIGELAYLHEMGDEPIDPIEYDCIIDDHPEMEHEFIEVVICPECREEVEH